MRALRSIECIQDIEGYGAGTTVTIDVHGIILPVPAVAPYHSANNRRVVITVADNGRGVTAEELQRLTDRFYRGTSANDPDGPTRPGTGLGLAIVDALVNAAGAELDISQSPGGGLTFTITVPVANIPAQIPTNDGAGAATPVDQEQVRA